MNEWMNDFFAAVFKTVL